MSNTKVLFIFFTLVPISSYSVNLRRIVGGEYAIINEYPHLGLMNGECEENPWICGASILNQRILLTAAHCVHSCKIDARKHRHRVAVFFGSTYISDMRCQRRISKIAAHDGWDEITGSNDIAVVKVKRDIPLGNNIKRVMVAREFPDVSRYFEAFVAGWGGDNPSSDETSGHLRKVYQRLRSSTSCSRYGKMYSGMYCAGRLQKIGEYPATGDSGSALVTRNRFHQIGVVSFGFVLYPAMTVYTNVSYFYDWILRNAADLYCNV